MNDINEFALDMVTGEPDYSEYDAGDFSGASEDEDWGGR